MLGIVGFGFAYLGCEIFGILGSGFDVTAITFCWFLFFYLIILRFMDLGCKKFLHFSY